MLCRSVCRPRHSFRLKVGCCPSSPPLERASRPRDATGGDSGVSESWFPAHPGQAAPLAMSSGALRAGKGEVGRRVAQGIRVKPEALGG